MKRNRVDVEPILEKEFAQTIGNRKENQKLLSALQIQFGFPESITANYVTRSRNLIEADDFLLFAFTQIYCPDYVEEWFTDQEIERYSKMEYHEQQIKFPLKYNVTQVLEDQYIGRITAQELMLLRDAQIIRYNPDTQRTMTRVNGDVYQPTLDPQQVRNIRDSYLSGTYIPDPITLNIPDEADYEFNEKTSEMIIRSIPFFDITDGFHRYVALQKAVSIKPDLSQVMELRLTNFTTTKADRFIWQEDQKVHMTKVESESLNTYKLSNKIVDRMNDSSFIMSGKFSRNGGAINSAQFANILEKIFLSNVTKSEEARTMKEVQAKLTQDIEELADIDPTILDKTWDKKFILSVIYESKYGSMENVTDTYQKISNDKTIYALNELKTLDIKRMKNLLGR